MGFVFGVDRTTHDPFGIFLEIGGIALLLHLKRALVVETEYCRIDAGAYEVGRKASVRAGGTELSPR